MWSTSPVHLNLSLPYGHLITVAVSSMNVSCILSIFWDNINFSLHYFGFRAKRLFFNHGNDLADHQAKAAAQEMLTSKEPVSR